MSSGKTQLKTKTLGIALILALCATGGLSVSAHADKGGNGHRNGHERHDYSSDNERSHGRDVIVINDKDREVIYKYAKSHYRHCPPGLAKKHNGCLPPGHAKRYEVGKRLPDDVAYVSVPYSLRRSLQAPPPGYQYVRVDNDVLLMSKSDRVVTDAITLLNDLAQ
jgi:Ni/Co efflux regulator RcnB